MQEDLGTSRGGAWGAVEPLRGVRGCAWGVTKLEEEPAEVTRAIVRATLGGSIVTNACLPERGSLGPNGIYRLTL